MPKGVMSDMKYFILLPLEILATIIAYLTNPLICLFANEKGELPPVFSWWQTWDNPLDIEWMIYEPGCTPKIFHYDFRKHYEYHPEDHAKKIAGYVKILDPNFTFKEKIQRYFCRLAWMYRNCNYGFSYDVTGAEINGDNIQVLCNIKEENNRQYFGGEANRDLFDTHWCLYYEKPWCKWFILRIFLGWKLKDVDPGESRRCMLAFFIGPFRRPKS